MDLINTAPAPGLCMSYAACNKSGCKSVNFIANFMQPYCLLIALIIGYIRLTSIDNTTYVGQSTRLIASTSFNNFIRELLHGFTFIPGLDLFKALSAAIIPSRGNIGV
jgi:hypothetical protein